jgi:D-3-phosphoglycerate dehydrogenase
MGSSPGPFPTPFEDRAHFLRFAIHVSKETVLMSEAAKVLISDKLSEAAVEIFRSRGLDVDFLPDLGKDKDALVAKIGAYDGIAIRSATKLTESVLRHADNLKVIGRAGIGVDNVDIPVATQKGIIVMNTPFGNSITTAEHAISLMLALARQIPDADRSTQAGKWEKNRFMGVELTGKTLGVIGCGNIGSIVADRGRGLKMKVIAFDPFLSPERAADMGIEKVELEQLLPRADFITLHTPLTEKTRNILSAENLAKTKKGVRIINCARGGLIDEAALKEGLESGQVAGAALDVFVEEPAKDNPLFGMPNLICTPHLGAATHEAQEKVALQVAEQMADYLTTGAITNALNMPSISAEEAPRLKPFVALAENLGSFAGQLTETGINGIRIEYEGDVAEMNVKALTSAALTGVLRPLLQDVNMVSAPMIAKERGIKVEEVRRPQQGIYETYIRLTILTERQERSVAGTVFSDGIPRIINIKGIKLEGEFAPYMLYVTNEDQPGVIGGLGTVMADHGVNIATFHLGRNKPGGDAISLLVIDQPLDDAVLKAVQAVPPILQAKPLQF